ncbi:MAG: hypothetical protein SFY68_01985, partial [Candidatus Sumerlaeia bacterium]|nr:hypothetical protein [Candidatus Sumerlaeia bacterium]
WAIFALLAGGGAAQMFSKMKNINDDIKRTIIDDYCNKFEAGIDGNAEAVAGKLAAELDGFSDKLNSEMDARIDQLSNLSTSALEKKRNGQEEVNREIAALNTILKQLDQEEANIDSIWKEVLAS